MTNFFGRCNRFGHSKPFSQYMTGIEQPSTSLHTWGPPCVFETKFN